jgi:hypothetical protein
MVTVSPAIIGARLLAAALFSVFATWPGLRFNTGWCDRTLDAVLRTMLFDALAATSTVGTNAFVARASRDGLSCLVAVAVGLLGFIATVLTSPGAFTFEAEVSGAATTAAGGCTHALPAGEVLRTPRPGAVIFA